MNTLDFLTQLRRAISEFTDSISNLEESSLDEMRDDILKFELAASYYNLIEYYFRDTNIPGDTNIMSQDELQIVIDKLNNIMDSYLYTDFS